MTPGGSLEALGCYYAAFRLSFDLIMPGRLADFLDASSLRRVSSGSRPKKGAVVPDGDVTLVNSQVDKEGCTKSTNVILVHQYVP